MAKTEKRTTVICNDWIAYTNIMDDTTAWILFKYMLAIRNGQEPPPLPDSLKYVMAHIQNFWSEQDQKYQEKVVDRNKENGKKGGRPPKQKPQKPSGLNKTQPNPKKPNKPKETLTDTITDTSNSLPSGRENTSNEVLVLDNNTSILNNNTDTWQNSKKFWNQEINEIIEMIASINEGAMDGTQARNRQFANNLLKKIKAMPKVANGEITRKSVLEMIITFNKDDEYHATKLTSPENIYRNFGSLVSLARTKYQEQNKRQKSDWVF